MLPPLFFIFCEANQPLDFIDINSFKLYRNHVMFNPIHAYGYVRKFPTKESHKKGVELLLGMIDRLKQIGYFTKIFVSPVSKAHQSILSRDMEVGQISLLRNPMIVKATLRIS